MENIQRHLHREQCLPDFFKCNFELKIIFEEIGNISIGDTPSFLLTIEKKSFFLTKYMSMQLGGRVGGY